MSYMLWPLHTQVKGHYHPLNRRLGGPPQPMWTFWRIEKFLVLAEDLTLDHMLLFSETQTSGIKRSCMPQEQIKKQITCRKYRNRKLVLTSQTS